MNPCWFVRRSLILGQFAIYASGIRRSIGTSKMISNLLKHFSQIRRSGSNHIGFASIMFVMWKHPPTNLAASEIRQPFLQILASRPVHHFHSVERTPAYSSNIYAQIHSDVAVFSEYRLHSIVQTNRSHFERSFIIGTSRDRMPP